MNPQDTDPLRAKGTDRPPFDWDDVEPEPLEALVEAVDDHRPLSSTEQWPMVTNEFGMAVIEQLWDRGWRLTPVPRRPYSGWSSPPGPLSRLVAWVRKWRRR